MIDRSTRLRWRRRFRRGRRQVEDIGEQAEQRLERHFFKRLSKLPNILRFSIGWVLLLILLIGGEIVQTRALANYYLVNKPIPGGIYTEGILGSFTNANPIYATNAVDNSVAHLVFAGLFKLDSNNMLVGDLAYSWTVDKTEQTYTVKLKKGITWQDGMPLTANDVAFTYQTIQNPDAGSPLLPSWQDVSVSAPNDLTIVFKLPNPLSSFPYSMTNGIIPQHLLSNIPPAQLRSVNFNSVAPIGAGPFKWSGVKVTGDSPDTREEQVALVRFDHYINGEPKLDQFIIKAFHNEQQMVSSFKKKELNGVAGFSIMPEGLSNNSSVHEYDSPLLSEVLVFFKTTGRILNDVKVRQALQSATNTTKVISSLGYPVAPARGPLLKSQLGYAIMVGVTLNILASVAKYRRASGVVNTSPSKCSCK